MGLFFPRRNLALATITSISAGTPTQWDGVQTWTINGSGIAPTDQVFIDGVAYTTTYVNGGQVTVSVPDALTSGSPLKTAGTKNVRLGTGTPVSNTATQSVTAWSKANITDGKRWYRGDAVGVTGSDINWWECKLGSGKYLLVDTIGYQASIASLNGRPGGSFNGTTSYAEMQTSSPADFTAANASCMWAVFTPKAMNTSASMTGSPTNNVPIVGSTQANWGIWGRNTPEVYGYQLDQAGTSRPANVATPLNAGSIVQWRWRGASTATYIRRNTVAAETSFAGGSGMFSTTGTIRIGGNINAKFAQMDLAEFFIAGADVPAVDQDRAMRELKDYYAL